MNQNESVDKYVSADVHQENLQARQDDPSRKQWQADRKARVQARRKQITDKRMEAARIKQEEERAKEDAIKKVSSIFAA